MRKISIIAIFVAIIIIVGATAFLQLAFESNKSPEVAVSPTGNAQNPSNKPGAPDDMPYTLSGFVIDKKWDCFPGAKVTLWETRYNSDTSQYINVMPAAINNNPTTSNSDPSVNLIGYYEFRLESPGTYNVTVEMDGYRWYKVTTIDKPGVCSLNVNSSDYVYQSN